VFTIIVYTGAGGSVSLAITAAGLAGLAAAWVAGSRPEAGPVASAEV